MPDAAPTSSQVIHLFPDSDVHLTRSALPTASARPLRAPRPTGKESDRVLSG